MKKFALVSGFLVTVLWCSYSCGKKKSKVADRYKYIEDIARENGFYNGGILAVRDTTQPVKNYPSLYGFSADGRLINTAGTCADGLLPVAKEIVAAADDPLKTDTVGTLALYFSLNPIYLLTGERLRADLLPKADVYLIYDYNPVAFAIAPGHLKETNDFVNDYKEKRIVFIKLCMMDLSKAMQSGTKQISL